MFVNGIPGEAKIALMRGWMVYLPLVLRQQ
jgi:hypothetical protein